MSAHDIMKYAALGTAGAAVVLLIIFAVVAWVIPAVLQSRMAKRIFKEDTQ